MIETTISGNVGSVRFAQAGETPVLNISIASSRKIGQREYTDWASAKIWGERASKLAPFIQKGAKLLLRGRPESKGFCRADGSVVGELVIHVHNLEFLSSPSKITNAEQLSSEAPAPTKPKRRKSQAM